MTTEATQDQPTLRIRRIPFTRKELWVWHPWQSKEQARHTPLSVWRNDESVLWANVGRYHVGIMDREDA